MASENFTLFRIVNVFSPDGDGVNDTWKIDGIENYPETKIKVMDRYGMTGFRHYRERSVFLEW
ncbi:T9SS type B sorting domain-containing protein [Halpernia sp. GG3]